MSGVRRDIAVKLMFVSYLALQVYLGPTGEEQLYNSSMTTVTGQHEGSQAILRNTMRQNSTVTVMSMKRQFKGVYLLLRTIHISHSLVQQSFQYYKLPYSQKYWRSLNLAVWSRVTEIKILGDLNLAVVSYI